jgi:membrane protein
MDEDTNNKPGLTERIRWFLAHDIWQMDDSAMPWHKRAGVRLLRIGWSAGHGFWRHACDLHASALTYYTLLALVPMLVMALALTRAFGGDNRIHDEIHKQVMEWVGEMPSTKHAAASNASAAETAAGQAFAQRITDLENNFFNQLGSVKLGTLGGIGLIALIWMSISMLSRVEESFNKIWSVESGRSHWRCFTDYLSVLLIVPLLAVAASTVPVADMIAQHAAVAGVSPKSVHTMVGSFAVKKIIVLGFTTMAFSFLLSFMPNTRVRLGPALAGGLFTAILFTAWLKFCTFAQVGIVKYNLLYGSFALLPILLAWAYTSWGIVLLGAEITATLQTGPTCPTERHGRPASPRSRLLLALALCAEAARSMRETGAPFDAEDFIAAHHLPVRFTRTLLADLVTAGFLAEVAGRPGVYLLCRAPDKITVADVARHVFTNGLSPLEMGMDRLDGTDWKSFGLELDKELARAYDRPLPERVSAHKA